MKKLFLAFVIVLISHIVNAGLPKVTMAIDVNDSLVFDLSQATCLGTYVDVPVYFLSDDPIEAVDFSMKFNLAKFTYNSLIVNKTYLTGLDGIAYGSFNTSDSTLRVTSYCFSQNMDNNSALFSIRFNILAGPILASDFNNIWAHLGNSTEDKDCSYKIVNNPQPSFCALPVELLSFDIQAVSRGVVLSWTTASETNNHYFTVERLSDLENWKVVGVLQGAGNSSIQKSYHLVDDSPSTGMNYYRLKQTDFDGTETFSKTEAFNFRSEDTWNFNIFPNPCSGKTLFVEYDNLPNFQNATINVFNLFGSNLLSYKLDAQESSSKPNSFRLPLDSMLPPGIYWVVLTGDSFHKVLNLVIQ